MEIKIRMEYCPECDEELFYEPDGFMDCYNANGGHYTISTPYYYCNNCDFSIDKAELEEGREEDELYDWYRDEELL